MNTVDLIASLIKSGRHEEAIQAVNELVETASALEREREEMQVRIAELEVYEEREMIGDPAGLGGPRKWTSDPTNAHAPCSTAP